MGYATSTNARTVRVIAASASVAENDEYIAVKAPGANVVVTLPAVASVPAGRAYYITRDDTATHTVTVTPATGEELNSGGAGVGTAIGAAGTPGGCVVVSDGTEWFFAGSH